jgi:hypothetical protein
LCNKHRGTHRPVGLAPEFSHYVNDREVIANDLGGYDE